MKILANIVLILGLFTLLFYMSIIISEQVISSKIAYKKAFVHSLFLEYNAYPKKYKELYSFEMSIEIAKYNAWLEQKQQQCNTILRYWIPDLSNEIPFTR